MRKNFFSLQIAWNGWLTQKTYVAFFPWCKNGSSIFFSVSKAFLKEYPVILILIPEVWTEEMKCIRIHRYLWKSGLGNFKKNATTYMKKKKSGPKRQFKHGGRANSVRRGREWGGTTNETCIPLAWVWFHDLIRHLVKSWKKKRQSLHRYKV